MKRTLLPAALLATVSTEIGASCYNQPFQQKEFCNAIAVVSASAYDERVAGVSMEVVLEKDAVLLNAGFFAASSKLVRFGIDYAYSKATDRKDAYLTSWSNCMDSIY